jgi:Mrp family chromosome partitioning ATPase
MEPKMGKMLEAFKQSNPKSTPRVEAPLVPAAPKPEVMPPRDADDESDMPFIEVGGKNAKMEASADVMACAAEAKPIVRPAPRPAEPRPREVTLTPRLVATYRGVHLQQAAVAFPQWLFFSPCFAPEVIVAHNARHPVCAQYEVLLGQILNPLGDRKARVICFLGAVEQCGTTTTVLNLALTAARGSDQLVTVVDANPRRPAVARYIGLEANKSESLWYQARKPANLRFVPWPERTRQSLATLLETLRADEGSILLDGPNLNDVREDIADLACDGLYIVSAEEKQGMPAPHLGRAIDGWIIAQ